MNNPIQIGFDPSIKVADILKAAESIGCRLVANENGIKVVPRGQK